MYMLTRVLLGVFFLSVTGCSEYKISKVVEEAEPGVTAPEIEVLSLIHI